MNVSDDITMYAEHKAWGECCVRACVCVCVCVCTHAKTHPSYSEGMHEASLRTRSKAVECENLGN